MSAIQWARTLRCDWPGCQSEGEVILSTNNWSERTMPAGWIDLGRSVAIRAIQPGHPYEPREFCSIHVRFTLAQLAEAFAAKEPASDDRA